MLLPSHPRPAGARRSAFLATPVTALAIAALAIAALLGACKSVPNAGPTPVEDSPEGTRTESLRASQGDLVAYHPTPNRARIIDFHASADSLWPRAINAYERLGLPLGEVDTRARTLGTSAVRAIGRIGDARLGDYVDCGAGPLGARVADTYVVMLRAITELKPQGDQTASATASPAPGRPPATAPVTTVRTLVTATAKANNTQGDAVDCVSTGRLETRLVRLIDPAAPRTTANPGTPHD